MQTYDILNEVGANLSNIQDDCQAGFMNMEEMINFLRVEKMHDKKKTYKLNHTTTDKKNENERKFKDDWGDNGIVMSWALTPVEQQKPQVNWRPDINSADESPKKLDSYQAGPGQTADDPGSTLKPGKSNEAMRKNLEVMNVLLEVEKKHKKNQSKNGKSDGGSGAANVPGISDKAKDAVKDLSGKTEKDSGADAGKLK